jgi:hypothetical protein
VLDATVSAGKVNVADATTESNTGTTASNTTTIAGAISSSAMQEIGAPDVTATGSLTAVSTGVTLSPVMGARPTLLVEISGTWVATVQVQEEINGVWQPVEFAWLPATGGPEVPSTGVQVNGNITANVGGTNNVRIWVTAYTSGAIVVAVRSSIAPHFMVSEDVNTGPGVSVTGSNYTTAGFRVTTQPCVLTGLSMYNASGAAAFPQVFAGAPPTSLQVPNWTGGTIGNNAAGQLALPATGIYFPNGFSIAISSTGYGFTAPSGVSNPTWSAIYRPMT